MKEINFRLWDKEEKKMCYDDFFNMFTPSGINSQINHFNNNSSYVLMQYTGRKDINDTDVYEGDIVKDVESIDTYLVAWSARYCCFHLSRITYENDVEIELTENTFYVIGNIYQNPELLEETK